MDSDSNGSGGGGGRQPVQISVLPTGTDETFNRALYNAVSNSKNDAFEMEDVNLNNNNNNEEEKYGKAVEDEEGDEDEDDDEEEEEALEPVSMINLVS